ncbi:Centrosomal protein of 72 kDa [Acipenser ruthenus]|uniref:Centrosomal protein of 72 kDa n=1 Tax=Acipenser ruthenus TaxID=7906 RepID=A0A662YKP9_ACIRT|nr:Centrosomal protein of 72 kDa [Acipenser ruthenus]
MPTADVRSLLLPGTYEGKIYHLGNSLKNFCRLKTLDLSRNALVSIEGIQHLKLLEKLNLYYNSIPSLNEIFHLRNLTALTELDLRLNPVVKNEPDYRLFIVHMLPNLRKLDDRPVRDSERKAAILHFGTELPFENQEASSPESETGNERTNQPRVSYVSCLSKKCSVLDEDDEAVLNLIAKCNWDLSKPPVITGSVKKAQEAELYPLQGNPKKDVQGLNGYHDGDETATSKQILASLPVLKKLVAPTLLESLLDQVDKYWNGKRSLHSNEKFLTKAIETLAAIRVVEEPDHSRFEDEMNRLKEEKEALHIQKDKQEQNALLEIQALNAQLSQTQKETVVTLFLQKMAHEYC